LGFVPQFPATIEAGKTTLNPKDFDLYSLLDIKFCQNFLDESEPMVEHHIIQLPHPKGDIAILANLKLRNRMLLGYAVPIALFVGLVAPVFSSASKGGESYRQTKISMTTQEGMDRMAFYLAHMAGDRRGYILNRDEYYLKDAREDLLNFNKLAESVGKTILNFRHKLILKY
jgi:hypothetical protein